MTTSAFTSLLNDEFKSLTTEDRVFVEPSLPLQGAWTASDTRERMYKMVEGYRHAADVLVEQAESDASIRNYLIYPIIYCYRHFIELEMKYVLVEYGVLAGEAADFRNHNFTTLWSKCKRVLDFCKSGDLTPIEQCIVEFGKVDPDSYSFRYAFETSGEPKSLEFKNIDLLKLRETMTGIYNFFLGVDGYLDSLASASSNH